VRRGEATGHALPRRAVAGVGIKDVTTARHRLWTGIMTPIFVPERALCTSFGMAARPTPYRRLCGVEIECGSPSPYVADVFVFTSQERDDGIAYPGRITIVDEEDGVHAGKSFRWRVTDGAWRRGQRAARQRLSPRRPPEPPRQAGDTGRETRRDRRRRCPRAL